MELHTNNERELKAFGTRLGAVMTGGEIVELVGDVGAGKTTLTKAIASGMGIIDDVGSPSYTLSQLYEAPHGLSLVHYDFYRLDDPGIMADELRETLADPRVTTVIEWGDIIAGVLPSDHLQVRITPTGETSRQLTLTAGGNSSTGLLEKLR